MSLSREIWKRQTFWSLPVYTGDVSGVCSALYELGGMVVMHDPSGCNSTYNTHDEVRWMDMESLIFLSGLKDIDAITGNDQKLVDDITKTALSLHPKFIAIANSPVPWLIGTDFRSICRKVEDAAAIPAFHVETNAMHDYTVGAGAAFRALAELLFEDSAAGRTAAAKRDDPADRIVNVKEDDPADRIVNVKEDVPVGRIVNAKEDGITGRTEAAKEDGITGRAEAAKEDDTVCRTAVEKEDSSGSGRLRVNVLGMTPLDFTLRTQLDSLRVLLDKAGFELISVWALGDDLQRLKRAPEADVNLVISSSGLKCAEYFQEKFGIPYVAGVPRGAFWPLLQQALREAAVSKTSRVPYLEALDRCRKQDAGAERCVAGEPVTMGSFAADLALSDGQACDIICLTETREGLISTGDRHPEGEAEIRQVLGKYREVTGDPLLAHACAKDAVFHEFPHFAYSGRVYLGKMQALIAE